MSRRDLDNQMMDYLYDELPPAERASFEREMQSDASLKAEVESMQATRSMVHQAELHSPMPAAPVALMHDLMREARKAVAPEPKPSFFDKLTAWLMQPAAATAMLVVMLVATGLVVMQRDDRSGEIPGTPTQQHYADGPRITAEGGTTRGAVANAESTIEAPAGSAAQVAEVLADETGASTDTGVAARDNLRGEESKDEDQTVADGRAEDGWFAGKLGADRAAATADPVALERTRGLDKGGLALAVPPAAREQTAEYKPDEAQAEATGEVADDSSEEDAAEPVRDAEEAPQVAQAETPATDDRASSRGGRRAGTRRAPRYRAKGTVQREVAQIDLPARTGGAGGEAGRGAAEGDALLEGLTANGAVANQMKEQPEAPAERAETIASDAPADTNSDATVDRVGARRRGPESQVAAVPRRETNPGTPSPDTATATLRTTATPPPAARPVATAPPAVPEPTVAVADAVPTDEVATEATPVAEEETTGGGDTDNRRVARVTRSEWERHDNDGPPPVSAPSQDPSPSAPPARVVYQQSSSGSSTPPQTQPAPAAPALLQPAAETRNAPAGQPATVAQPMQRQQGQPPLGLDGQPTGAAVVDPALRQRMTSEYQQAMSHYRSRRYNQAIRAFELYLKQHGRLGNAPEAQRNLARSYEGANKLQQAVQSYRTLLARYPRYPGRMAVLIDAARAEMRVGNLNAARTYLAEAARDRRLGRQAQTLLEQVDARIEQRERERAAQQQRRSRQRESPAPEPAAGQKAFEDLSQ